MNLLPRGLRNNNPLNIRRSASQWQGMRTEQTDRAFVQFTSMVMGYRAAWRTLETYYKHFEAERKPFTPRNIIYRWAPPMENDSEAYLRRICHLTTLAGNAPLSRPSRILTSEDKEKLVSLIAAMACVENGIKMEAVSKEDIRTARRMAFK